MTTLKRIVWRLLAGLGVLWGAATLTFVTINLTGGDPALAILGGPEALPTPQVLERVRLEYHLDRPLYEQYFFYLGRILKGDLGESYRLRIPVTKAIGQQLLPTLELALWAGLTATVVSVTIAILTARRAPWIRTAVSGIERVVSSVPGFILGIGLLLLFAFQLHWVPASSRVGDSRTMILPTLALAIPIIAIITQVLRNELEEILEQPFIVTARARGLSEAAVRLRHALRHALIPLLTLSGFLFAQLLGGAVIAETLFNRQGVGRLMADATSNKDVPIVLGVTLFAAATYVVVHLIVDLLTSLVDPRVKLT
jgi:peptide/nickel transport system permease protein